MTSREPPLVFVGEGATDIPAGSDFVERTTLAYHRLHRDGRRLSTVSDHIDHRFLRSDISDYLRWQSDWLHRLDDQMGLGGAAVAAAYLIKTPLDSLVMAARELMAVVMARNARSVVYTGTPGTPGIDPWHYGHLQFCPALGDEPLAARLLPLITSALGIPFAMAPSGASPSPLSGRSPAPAALRTIVAGRVATLRNFWTMRPARPEDPASLVLWRAGYGVRTAVRDERRRSQRVLFLLAESDQYRLVELRPLGTRTPWRGVVNAPPVQTPPPELPAGIDSLLEEVDLWTGLPGSATALRSRFVSFVSRVCPAIAEHARVIEPGLKAAGVNTVIAANPSSVADFAVLLSAG